MTYLGYMSSRVVLPSLSLGSCLWGSVDRENAMYSVSVGENSNPDFWYFDISLFMELYNILRELEMLSLKRKIVKPTIRSPLTGGLSGEIISFVVILVK